MAGRLLLGIVAALRAVLIPGQVELLTSQPLSWPRLRLADTLPAAPGDRRELAPEARTA